MLDEFQKWQYDTEQAIKEWPEKLVEEALKQGTYDKAERWLKRKQPDYSDSFLCNSEEQFIVTIKVIYDEAIHKLRRLAMKQKVGK